MIKSLLNLPTPDGQGNYTGLHLKLFFNQILVLLGQNGSITSAVNSLQDSLTPITQGSMWPVGSVFITIGNTNPNSLLGFGSWTATGSGTLLGATCYGWKRIN